MANPSKTRLMFDTPALGAWNMAVDQALLESAEATGQTTLRFYSWSEPTLSLGYFQGHEDRNEHASSNDCPLIRRASGGGAILHHHELTYSLCIPSSNRWSSKNADLYQLVHRIIIECLNQFRAGDEEEAQLYSELIESKSSVATSTEQAETPGETRGSKRPFLCFQRRTDGDIVIGKHKVVGSAQRRLKKSLLQHGSILLAQSKFAPELVGIKELRKSWEGNVQAMQNQIAKEFVNELKLELVSQDCQLTEKESLSVKRISETQFGCKVWTLRR